MPSSVTHFIYRLAASTVPPYCTNPYGVERPYAAQRRHNLQTYLELMVVQKPDLLLVGEAPGYRGCRLTGIPFVSPHVLANLGERFRQSRPLFQAVPEWPECQGEASATIVWRTIGALAPLPLLWNIFPFHPHKPDKPQSNRTPTAKEIAVGRPFLMALLKIFPDTTLIAVGKKAATGLAKWGLKHTAVRHPSHGGAKQFQAGLRRYGLANL